MMHHIQRYCPGDLQCPIDRVPGPEGDQDLPVVSVEEAVGRGDDPGPGHHGPPAHGDVASIWLLHSYGHLPRPFSVLRQRGKFLLNNVFDSFQSCKMIWKSLELLFLFPLKMKTNLIWTFQYFQEFVFHFSFYLHSLTSENRCQS